MSSAALIESLSAESIKEDVLWEGLSHRSPSPFYSQTERLQAACKPSDAYYKKMSEAG